MLRENEVAAEKITQVAINSVVPVPSLDYSIRAAFLRYFKNRSLKIDPFKNPGVKTGLN